MAEDASLDDFLSETDEGTDQSASDDETVSDDEAAADEPDAAAAETPARATTTYAWDGAGGTCGSCGEVVERRWQQDGALVCSACKDWTE